MAEDIGRGNFPGNPTGGPVKKSLRSGTKKLAINLKQAKAEYAKLQQ